MSEETKRFDETYRLGEIEYRAQAFTRDGEPSARVVILRDGEVVAENPDYPSYRIYNVAAHLPDIAASIEEGRE